MNKKTLLVELLTEELPPKALEILGQHFAQGVFEGLVKEQLVVHEATYTAYASPRRLAVKIENVQEKQEDVRVLKKGPALSRAHENGQPSKALEGFARSCQVSIEALKVVSDGKQEVYAHEFTRQGLPLEELLSDIVTRALKKLPIPKLMRWGDNLHTFVRPVHKLLMLHGENIIVGEVLGLKSSRETLGHRFLSRREISIRAAETYEAQLKDEGRVIAQFCERKRLIYKELSSKSATLNAQVAANEALLDEVAALVEWPVVLEAGFAEHFLQVPQECLILTMQQNQKYFPLLNDQGKLINRFLLVSNLETADPSYIIDGNERVLRARLSDAEFFFEQDRKVSLEQRLPKLEHVIYHNKLGTQAERVKRLKSLSKVTARMLGADLESATRAALLAKADLLSEMVGEFPELQGTMGYYYALNDGETEEVARAIGQHYRPRFALDELPDTLSGTAVALADKLETLVGIWGIGLIPSSDKDPFALRRNALGILRILMKHNLVLEPLIKETATTFSAGALAENTTQEVAEFMKTRLSVFLQNDYAQDEVAATLAKNPPQLGEIIPRLQAVAAFKRLPEAESLASANKRVLNILKKNPVQVAAIQPDLLTQNEEKALALAVDELSVSIAKSLENKDFQAALSVLASVKPLVDAFFEQVMVMTEDKAIQNNRLSLLHALSLQLNAVADISLLASA